MTKQKKLTNEEMLQESLKSPALQWQSDRKGKFAYPANFRGRVPLKVTLAKTVKSDLMQLGVGEPDTIALKDNEYYAWTNSYGAVSAILPNGKHLGLYPQEFDVTAWHNQ